MSHSAIRMRLVFAFVCGVCALPTSVVSGSNVGVKGSGQAALQSDSTTITHRTVKVHLREPGPVEALVLERFEVFAPDVTIVLHTRDGDQIVPPPANSYFKGHVSGRDASRVYLVHLEDGTIRGVVAEGNRHWVLGGNAFAKSDEWLLDSREIEPVVELNHDAVGFACETDLLQRPPVEWAIADDTDVTKGVATKSAAYTARIAVETDNEFFNKFGNETEAINYVADIIAFGSIMYSAEVNTSWILAHLSLWSQGQTDPWAETNPGCGLYEFGRYWNDVNNAILRTTTAFLSGKNTNSGIAWVGVLCSGQFNADVEYLRDSSGVLPCTGGLVPRIDNYGGAYAYIGGVDGNFDIHNPAVLWDIVAVTHEIGHNFNSPHSHCYAGIGGNSNQIDHCYAGEYDPTYRPNCYSGTTSLPSDCPGGGSGCGTIMSYCHQLSPGMSNLSLTLGLNHPYGIEPERVPERMFSHVTSRASSYPGCLDYTVTDMIFEDDFESHNINAWSSTVP